MSPPAGVSQGAPRACAAGADRRYISKMRRLAVVSALALCCCTSAEAGILSHPGAPVLPGSSSTRALQAYPRTLVELDHVRGVEAAAALHRAGGELIDPSLSMWRPPGRTPGGPAPG